MKRNLPLVVGIRSHVVGIDPTTGSELWRSKLRSGQHVTILLRENRAFAGVSGELFAVDRATGRQLWHNRLKGLGLGLIAFAGDPERTPSDLLIGIKGHIVAIDPSTGSERWRTKLSRGLTSDHLTLSILDSQAVLAGSSGEVFAVNRSTGSVLWNAPLKGLGLGLVSLGPGEMATFNAAVQAQRAAAAAG